MPAASQLWIGAGAPWGESITVRRVKPVVKGTEVAGSGRDMRRVSLYADALHVDLVLPAAVPVAALLPSVRDVLSEQAQFRFEDCPSQRYQLSRPGMAALNPSTTLADNDIHDGAVLVLTRSSTELPTPVVGDDAEAVSVTLAAATRPWTRRAATLTAGVVAAWLAGLGGVLLVRSTFAHRLPRHDVVAVLALACCGALLAAVIARRMYHDETAGLTFGLLCAGSAALAGSLAVPDGPGAPNVLLAAMAAGVGSVLAQRFTGCGATTFTTIACVAMSEAGAALAAVITMAPLRVIGAISVLASMGLLEASARVSLAWAGLSPLLSAGAAPADEHAAPSPAELRRTAIQANSRLTSLVIASACTAGVGGVCTVATTPGHRFAGIVFAAITGAMLLLRARCDAELTRALALCATGTATVSATLVVAAASRQPVWPVTGIAAVTAAAVYAAFVAPRLTSSPIARRGLEWVEYSGLVAMVPLACGICGFYTAVRGVRLT